MKAFAYVAYTADGARKAGTIVAETEVDASAQLKAQGLYVSDLTARSRGRTVRARSLGFGPARLSRDLQAVFTRQMAVLLSAEMAVDDALGTLKSAGSTAALDQVVARAQAALLEGEPLSVALDTSGAGFPRYYLAAVQAGERAGELSNVFNSLAEHLETARSDRAQLGSALVYPAFVAVVSVLVAGVLFVTVAPEIVALFETSGRPLPDLTRRMMALSRWIEGHMVLLGGIALALIAFGVISGRVPSLRDKRDTAFLRLPVVGTLMRQGAAVQYLRTLALVLDARHTVPIAVESAGSVLTITRFRAEIRQSGRGDPRRRNPVQRADGAERRAPGGAAVDPGRRSVGTIGADDGPCGGAGGKRPVDSAQEDRVIDGTGADDAGGGHGAGDRAVGFVADL